MDKIFNYWNSNNTSFWRMTDKAENPYDEKSDVPHDKEERKKRHVGQKKFPLKM